MHKEGGWENSPKSHVVQNSQQHAKEMSGVQ